MFFKILFLALLLSGCATHTENLRAKFPNASASQIIDVPFYNQAEFHCAPAALKMMTGYLNQEIAYDELVKMLYAPEAKGTFQNDLLAATRRLSLLALPVDNMEEIIKELQDKRPVLVFQNLALSWIPKWHYAVVVGYDLDKKEVILHTGDYKNFPMSMRTFEKTWKRVDQWGYIIVKPGEVPLNTTEEEMVAATAGLELAMNYSAAKISYEAILNRWSESFGAIIGLGNVHFQMKEYIKSKDYFHKATILRPTSIGVWNNYAVALKAAGDDKGADKAKLKIKELSATQH